MNDLIQPALYDAFHRIWPVAVPAGISPVPAGPETAVAGTEPWDVVDLVCESGDFFAEDCLLPRLDHGTLITTFSAGAYAMAIASN